MFGGDGFMRLKLPMGFRNEPDDSCGISENFLVSGEFASDFDDASEQMVKLLVDSIEYEF